MSLIDSVREYVSSSPTVRTYRCEDCEATFDSAKPTDRAKCPECLGRTVSEVEE